MQPVPPPPSTALAAPASPRTAGVPREARNSVYGADGELIDTKRPRINMLHEDDHHYTHFSHEDLDALETYEYQLSDSYGTSQLDEGHNDDSPDEDPLIC